MGKDKKKKGKGAEKTAAKTEKKGAKKLKKELAAKGEDDIEQLIAKFTEEDSKRDAITEEISTPPSLRSNFTFVANPDKDELILFGGEFFNGIKTLMYNDLYVYNLKKKEWTMIKTPNPPPPRCAHQAVTLSQGGGQMWIFGGEFASPTQSQFYHYRDLWVFHLQTKLWEKINASNGPSSRSGHRMCISKRNIIVFGGFHDNLRDYKYYDDVYAFNLDTYKWTKLDCVGNGPCPRSACQMVSCPDGRIIIYGGYSKLKVKKDVDQGVVHADMYCLQPDAKSPNKWKWTQIKQSGVRPSLRSGFSLISISDYKAILFGGVFDEEDEEQLQGNFFNDLCLIELDVGKWSTIELKGSDTAQKKVRRRKKNKDADCDSGDEDSSDEEVKSNDVTVGVKKIDIQEQKEVNEKPDDDNEDEIFKVTIGPQTTEATSSGCVEVKSNNFTSKANVPHPRMNGSLAMKHGILYLYGGCFEEGDKQITLDDFYMLDVRKFDEWKTIIPMSYKQEWIASESDDSDGSDCDESEEDI